MTERASRLSKTLSKAGVSVPGCIYGVENIPSQNNKPSFLQQFSKASKAHVCVCHQPTSHCMLGITAFSSLRGQHCYHLLQPWAGSLTVYASSQLYRTITFQNSPPKPKLLLSLSETENFGSWGCWWPEAIPSE